MVIKTAKIKNFRGIEEKEFEFKPGFNLIIGENGQGKTSALEAIAVGLGGFVSGINKKAVRGVSDQEIRRTYPMLGDGSVDEKLNFPVEIDIDAVIDRENCHWTRSRNNLFSDVTNTHPSDVSQIAQRLYTLVGGRWGVELPIVLYEGTERVWAQNTSRTVNIPPNNYYRSAGYENALTGKSDANLLVDWCLKMELVSWQKESSISEYKAVKDAVALFMHEMNQEGDYKVLYDKQIGKLMFQTEKKRYSVDDLSSGYQSLVWMVFDIAYRSAVLNPDKFDKITETSGVVLIDEIDLHLHPKWQWNIIHALRTVFPNVQFIAATHSPILLASAKDVWIIDMEKDDVKYTDSQFGLDVNNTLRQCQKTENVYPQIQAQMNQFYLLIDEGDYSKAKDILEKLENEMGSTNPLLTKMKTTLDLELLELED